MYLTLSNLLPLAPIEPGAGVQGSWSGLVLYVLLALGISFLCSVLEAVLLSTSPSYVEVLVERGYRAGKLMQKHKQDVERRISAILTLNTIAHTVGAAGAGAQAAALFGNQYIGLISAILTLLILVLSEIIPKTLGAVYWKRLTPPAAYIIQFLVITLLPAVWVFEKLTRLLRPAELEATVTRADLAVLAKISTQEGILLERESRVLHNLLQLNKVNVEAVMTPRTVVMAFQEDWTIRDVVDNYDAIPYSRIPLYGQNMDDVSAYVLRYDILQRSALDEHQVQLKELANEIYSVPETVTVADVLNDFMVRQEHIALVIDEYGGTAGIVTMEDAIESLLGIEITDESDVVENLRKLAEQRFKRRLGEQRLSQESAL